MSKRSQWILIALAVIVALALAAWTIFQATSSTPMKVKAEADRKIMAQATLTDGARTYAAWCAYCHENGVAPSLTGKDLSPQAVVQFVRQGYDVMPAFTPGTISDAELARLSAYVSKLSDTPATEKKP